MQTNGYLGDEDDTKWIDLDARDENGNSALILAVLSNRPQAVQAIGHKSINRNRFSEIYSAKNKNGDTALTLALKLRHWECVRALEKAKHLNRRNSMHKKTELLKRAQTASYSMFATKNAKNRYSLNNSDPKMNDEFKKLMKSEMASIASSESNIHDDVTTEADAQDVKPKFDEEKNEPLTKERSNTTPAHYLQWLSKPKMNIGKGPAEIGGEKAMTTEKRTHSGEVIANALAASSSNARSTNMPHMRMGSSSTDVIPCPWDDVPVPQWNPPEHTDMATPQASMLMTLRQRLRSIVVTKPKQDFYAGQAEGMRTCKSYTDVNEEEDYYRKMEELKKKSSVEKMASGNIVDSDDGRYTTASSSNQFDFHDLSGSNILTPTSGGNPLAIGSKLFRSRAKSEAHRREKIYKKKEHD